MKLYVHKFVLCTLRYSHRNYFRLIHTFKMSHTSRLHKFHASRVLKLNPEDNSEAIYPPCLDLEILQRQLPRVRAAGGAGGRADGRVHRPPHHGQRHPAHRPALLLSSPRQRLRDIRG
jgi:hypothetical protein